MIFFCALSVLVCLSACLSGSETSLFSLSPTKLKMYQASQNPKQQQIASLMHSPRDVLVTLLMLNILVNILIQNTVADALEDQGWLVKVGLPLVLVLVFGEILPKSIAWQKNVYFASVVSPWVEKIFHFVGPVRKPLTKFTSSLARLFSIFLKKEGDISLDELRHVLQASEAGGVILSQESDLIEGSLDLQQGIARERMRPRDEILYYDIQDPLDSLIHLLVDLETTRVPVCDGDLEKIVGVISTESFFIHREKIQTGTDVVPIVKKPYFVPETIKAWTLLQNLREKGESLALVVDEYGSISGLITQEDLIEAVVGEINDLRDPSDLYTRSGTDVIIANGKLELSEFKEIFGVALKSQENIVTLGGWLIEQLGDIPSVGTKYESDPFLFYILSAEPKRVRRIYVRYLKKPLRVS